MEWARRPERDTPRAEQRTFRDDRGRTWVGSVTSGTLRGGEEHAEVVFVCVDQPGELKRFARLDIPPSRADEAWRGMADEEVLDIFRRSEPA